MAIGLGALLRSPSPDRRRLRTVRSEQLQEHRHDGDYASDQLLWLNVVRAVRQVLILTSLSVVTTAGVEAENAGSASGLFNMMRNLGARSCQNVLDQARAVSLQRVDAVGLDFGTGDADPD